jgi:hypothetical protein
MLYVDKNIVNTWYAAGTGKVGGQLKYSDIAIETMLKLYYVFNLSLSGSIGFMTSLLKLLGLEVDVPDESRLSRRGKGVKLTIRHNGKYSDASVFSMDSSGLQIYGQGEWNRKKHGDNKRKQFVKLHILVNNNTLEIVDIISTNSDVHDCEVFDSLLKNVPCGSTTLADGAYGNHDAYNKAVQKDIYLIAKPKLNDVINNDNPNDGDMLRNLHISKFKNKGLYAWANKVGYWRRNDVENTFGRVKQQFGSRLKSRNMANQLSEIAIKCNITNDFMKLSMNNGLRAC